MVITASDFTKAPNRDAHKTPAVLNRSFRILLPVAPLLRGYAAAASFLKCHSSSQLSKTHRRRSPLTLCFEDTILLSPQILLLLNEVKITRPELGFDRGENRREQDSLEHLWLVAINCLDPVHELLSFREP